ncbi:S1 family peptidase [Tamaricihabitans halophyticus]|nr:serine protease [Tamaricihabitans halophyticus]
MAGMAALAMATPANAIINGTDATEDYSFVTTIRDAQGQHYCGGALIAPDWVVTAGHCTHLSAKDMSVQIGSNDRQQGGTERNVTKIVEHPDYDPEPLALRRDIALLKLDAPVRQEPIRIADTRTEPSSPVRIMGWGMTCEDGTDCPEPPTTLQQLDTEIVRDKACTGFEPESDTCSEHPSGKAQACTLDSGGPVIQHNWRGWELSGVMSRDGDFDTNPRCVGPMIWTDTVAHKPWIKDTIGGA